MTFNPNLKSQRLLGAVDLLLKAIESQEGMNSLIPTYSHDAPADAAAPTPRYTLMELVDAMTILVRMGIVPTEPKVGTARRHGGHLLNPSRPKRQTKSTDTSRPSNARPPRVRAQAIRLGCVASAALN